MWVSFSTCGSPCTNVEFVVWTFDTANACVYTYTYLYIYIYICTYVHIHTYVHVYIHTHTHSTIHTRTAVFTQPAGFIYDNTHNSSCVSFTNMCAHTEIAHTYVCIYVHIHHVQKKKNSCPGHLATTWARSRKRRERLEKNGNECSQLSFTYYVCHQAEVFWSSLPHAMGTWEIIQEKKTKLLKRGDNVCLRHPFFFLDQRQWFQNTNECPQLCYLCSSNKKVSLLICIWKIKAVRLCIYLGMCTYTHVYTYSQSYFGTYIFRTHTCKFTLLGVCVYTSVCIHVCSCVYTEIDWNQCTHTQPCCTYSKK